MIQPAEEKDRYAGFTLSPYYGSDLKDTKAETRDRTLSDLEPDVIYNSCLQKIRQYAELHVPAEQSQTPPGAKRSFAVQVLFGTFSFKKRGAVVGSADGANLGQKPKTHIMGWGLPELQRSRARRTGAA